MSFGYGAHQNNCEYEVYLKGMHLKLSTVNFERNKTLEMLLGCLYADVVDMN